MKNSPYPFIFILISILAIITNGVVNCAFAQDSGFIIKGMAYSQTSASGPVSLGYIFSSQLACVGASTVTNVVLTPPGKSPITMEFEYDEFNFDKQYVSQLGMDSEFPNGNYTMSTMGANYTASISITLTGNSYPTTPQISNFTAAQSIDPNQDFTLTWNALGLTSNDFIQISISGVNLTDTVFETPSPLKPGALKGNLTSFTIPANTLYPGLQYKGELVAAKIINVITNNNPDGTKTVLASGYVKFLEFSMRTTGTTTNIFTWKRPNFVFFFPDGSIVGTNAQYSTPRTIQNYNMYFQAFDSSPTNSVLFSGPAGSGLNNTPSDWYNYNIGTWASYSPPFVNITSPNQITGGVYTITYKGVNLKFNFSDPQVANKQIFLVPEFVVGTDGVLSEIKWAYLRSDGTKIPPQGFMKQVGILVNATWNAPLFENWNLRPGFTNYPVTNAVVYWNDVGSVQIGYSDVDYNNFMTIWKAPSGPRPMTIVTDSLSGTVGQEFSEMLNVSGGMYPYTWSIEYGFLPSGLLFDEVSGLISGTPGEAGLFKINVKVKDAQNSTATKDIQIRIADGTFTHKPAFTNMAKINGLPEVTILTMPDQFYRFEMSQNLKNWEKAFFFTAASDKMSVRLPQEIFQSYNRLFFRVAMGHKFYTDFYLIFYANAGIINNNAPYNVTINYPVSIIDSRAIFTAGFDPDYATLDEVYFGPPINAAASKMYSRADEDDTGIIGYESKSNSGILPEGDYTVTYKGTNMLFHVEHKASLRLVIPALLFTVNNGALTEISWSYKNPADGVQYQTVPSFITNGFIEVYDNVSNRIYDYCLEDRNRTNHVLWNPINWSSIRSVHMIYDDDLNSRFVIRFTKN